MTNSFFNLDGCVISESVLFGKEIHDARIGEVVADNLHLRMGFSEQDKVGQRFFLAADLLPIEETISCEPTFRERRTFERVVVIVDDKPTVVRAWKRVA